jgi:hypothetical protein
VVFQNLQELMIARDPFFKPDNASHDDVGSIKVMQLLKVLCVWNFELTCLKPGAVAKMQGII